MNSMLTIRILKKTEMNKKRTLRKLKKEVSQIIRMEPQNKEELNKKINTEIIVAFTPMTLTLHHHPLFKKDKGVKAEPAKRTKMKILKSLKK